MADLSITATSVSASNQATIRREFPAGATITAGMFVYKDTNNRWQPFDSNVGASLGGNVADTRGIALHNSANTQPLAVCTADPNFGIGATVTNGVSIYGSNTAGGLTHDVQVSGATTVFVGLPISTTRINLSPVAGGVAV
jgi:hypothetical protein